MKKQLSAKEGEPVWGLFSRAAPLGGGGGGGGGGGAWISRFPRAKRCTLEVAKTYCLCSFSSSLLETINLLLYKGQYTWVQEAGGQGGQGGQGGHRPPPPPPPPPVFWTGGGGGGGTGGTKKWYQHLQIIN